MNRKHWDARGTEVLEWSILKGCIKHQPSVFLLKRNLLCKLVVHPYICLEICKDDPTDCTITWFGTGPSKTVKIYLNQKQVKGLRGFFKNHNRERVSVDVNRNCVRFVWDARITRDSLRRY